MRNDVRDYNPQLLNFPIPTNTALSIELIQVRASLLDALQVDLIGPSGPPGGHCEVLPIAPSRWFLNGFLVPWGRRRGPAL